jgi:hypothetical protein
MLIKISIIITTENQDELGILVQVQCNYDNCNFVPLDY